MDTGCDGAKGGGVKSNARIACLLVDPSLYTGPYDAALTEGLLAAGVEPLWATRPTRRGDEDAIPREHLAAIFYRRTDDTSSLSGWMRSLIKGCSHIVGLLRLMRLVARRRPQVVHIQWAVLPLIDAIAFWIIRLRTPIVMTVHDPTPYNGSRLTLFQQFGFDLPIRLANHVIVHTRSGRRKLLARGIDPTKISVVQHGPLHLRAIARAEAHERDGRYTFVLFGEIKEYKGLDVLVEALAQLPAQVRDLLRVIVAGRARMDLSRILARIDALSLSGTIDIQPRRFSDQEMADLFAAADCFVFPYREIDASGVYFLTKGLRKWLIASRVGVFAEDVAEGRNGVLIPSGDARELANALQHAALTRPGVPSISIQQSWSEIGHATRATYERVLSKHARAVPVADAGAADA